METKKNYLRTRSNSICYLCGKIGFPYYQGLKDRSYNIAGDWNLKKCSDPKCGLIWLDPLPIEEDIWKAYETYLTHHDFKNDSESTLYRLYRFIQKCYISYKYGYTFNEHNIWRKLLGFMVYLHPGRRADCDHSVLYLPAEAKGRLLDVGCGNGIFLRQMQELGWAVEGVDFDPSAVENARSKGLKVREGQLIDQRYSKDSFEAVTLSHLIEHVHDPTNLLKECRRILKPGGILVIVTPNANSLGHKLFKDSWLHLDPPRHLHIFSIESIRSLYKKAGFHKSLEFTTIHGSSGMFIGSREIARKVFYRIGSRQSILKKLWSRWMQLREWSMMKRDPFIGEEIILILKK